MTVTATAQAARRTAGPPTDEPPAPRALPTLFGALSVIGGATALVPLITGLTWLWPLAEVVALIWLVGVGARLLAVPPWATELLRLATFAVAVTGLHLHTGISGILPGRAALDEVVAAVRAAWQQIMTTPAPMPATPEVSLLVTLVLGLLALVVNLLIDAARSPALVALPLLALYSVPASIAPELLPWYSFVLPAACYAAILVASGAPRDRPSPRTHSSAATSATIAVLSIAAALILADSVTSVSTEGRLPHTSGASSQIGLSPWAKLRGELLTSDPVDVANIAGLAAPSYLRTFALEKWEPDTGFALGTVTATVHNIDGELPGNGSGSNSSSGASDTGGAAWATITPRNYRDKYLPLYLDASAVDGLPSGWNYDSDMRTAFRASATTPGSYRVLTSESAKPAATLRSDPVAPNPALSQTGDLPPEVVRLAQSITAGTDNAFDAVDALLHFFTDPANGFTYSLQTAEGNSGNALVDFLSQRQGYCEQYAAAMAIMARAVGIPARVGIGFTQGERQENGSYEITSTNAHAWVEVPFEGAGWVIFDPTPSVDGQGGLQGFTTDSATPDATTSATSSSTATSPDATSTGTTTGPATGATSTVTITPPAGAGLTNAADRSVAARWVIAVLVLAAALAIVLAAPRAIRGRRRRRAMRAAAGGGPHSASAAWREIVDTARDHGVAIAPGTSARLRALAIRDAAGLSPRGQDRLRDVVTSVEREWYGPEVGAGRVTPDLTRAVRTVITGLRRGRPLSAFGRWWPRSLIRRP